MSSFLAEMRASTRRAVQQDLESGRAARWRRATPRLERDAFLHALDADPEMAVIAEIKRASPSAGSIDNDLDAAAQARRYCQGGAAAISVLTEPTRFGGSLDDLAAVSAAVPVPTLRKDFVLHHCQIDAAIAHGASAVLVIVAFVEPAEVRELVSYALERGIEPLVEIHEADELAIAVSARARVVGVNARNLHTLEVDREAVLRQGPPLCDAPGVQIAIAESGIRRPAHSGAAFDVGYRAVLVGEALVRADDPAVLIRQLRGPWGQP